MKHETVVLVLTCLTVVAVNPAQSVPPAGNPDLAIPFELNHQFGSILIEVQVNRQPARLLVDTGSSHTVLTADILEISPLFFARATVPVKGSGLTGTARWATATIDLGTIKWANRKVLVMEDFREISKSMQQRVDGILGEDVLNEFASVVIDFKNHRLILHR
jgi:predicted aspartyl protease